MIFEKSRDLPKTMVLGGSGFIGSHVAKKLALTNAGVVSGSKTTGLDLTDLTATENFIEENKPDFIFNCAAHVGSLHYVSEFAADVFHDNVQMSLNLYRAVAKKCPKSAIINPLSNCSYPGNSNVQTEESWQKGPVHDSVFAYGNAKRILYMLAVTYQKQFGIKSFNFLVPNTFGPGDTVDPNKTHALNGMIIRMIKAKKNNETEFEIWGSGNPVREWAYVDDVADILVESMDLQENLTDPVNIGQNMGYSIKESAEIIAQAVNYHGELVFNTKYQDGDPVKILDNKKFNKFFPNFKFKDHREGIAETVKYYQTII